jgi:hypothetical protein
MLVKGHIYNNITTGHTEYLCRLQVIQKVEVPSYTIYILFTIKDISRVTCFDPAGSSQALTDTFI